MPLSSKRELGLAETHRTPPPPRRARSPVAAPRAPPGARPARSGAACRPSGGPGGCRTECPSCTCPSHAAGESEGNRHEVLSKDGANVTPKRSQRSLESRTPCLSPIIRRFSGGHSKCSRISSALPSGFFRAWRITRRPKAVSRAAASWPARARRSVQCSAGGHIERGVRQ